MDNDTEYENITDEYDFFMEQLSEEYDKYVRFSIAVIVLAIALALFGVIANCIVCGVLLRKKRLFKNFSNHHLFNLVLTDILFRVVITPMILTLKNTAVKHGNNALCKLGTFGTHTTLAVTFLLLLGIAFDRYVHIVHPLKARNIRWKHSRNAVVISWLYAAACSSPFLFSTQYVKIDGNATESAEYELCMSEYGLPFQVSSTVFLIFAFLIPLVLMGAAYGAILRVLWMRARDKLMNKQIAEAKFRAVKMMVVIVLAYLISWGPFLIWTCLQAFNVVSLEYPNDDTESEDIDWEKELAIERRLIRLFIADDFFFLFTFTSSVLNPLIFGYYNHSFRQELKKCCCGGKCCRNCQGKATGHHTKEEKANGRSLEDVTNTTEIYISTKL